jgi:hypothetical protein
MCCMCCCVQMVTNITHRLNNIQLNYFSAGFTWQCFSLVLGMEINNPVPGSDDCTRLYWCLSPYQPLQSHRRWMNLLQDFSVVMQSERMHVFTSLQNRKSCLELCSYCEVPSLAVVTCLLCYLVTLNVLEVVQSEIYGSHNRFPLKIRVFWNVTFGRFVNSFRRFESPWLSNDPGTQWVRRGYSDYTALWWLFDESVYTSHRTQCCNYRDQPVDAVKGNNQCMWNT